MKLMHKYLLPQAKHIKLLVLMGVFVTLALNTYAQNSGLQIATSGEAFVDSRTGEIRGIEASIAVFRKAVVNNAASNFNNVTAAQLQNPQGSTKDATLKKTPKKIVASETAVKDTPETAAPINDKDTVAAIEVKQVRVLNIPATTTMTSATIYDIPGTTAIPSRQYTSLQAGFKFTYFGRRGIAQSPAGVIELYKLEKGINTRSFCIPWDGCSASNIPIQITANGQPVAADSGTGRVAGTASGKSPLYLVVLTNGGYLQPGEYAFIDKSSLTHDGSAMVCFAFTVRQ